MIKVGFNPEKSRLDLKDCAKTLPKMSFLDHHGPNYTLLILF
jgi:hypothetical protein